MDPFPKYSMPEVERRWLVDAAKIGGLSKETYRLIEDVYIKNSHLRLRKMTAPDGTTLFKLGKKYGKFSHLSEPMTTLYLDAEEYKCLSALDGQFAVKKRYALAGGSLDVYEKPNSGLMIFELEFANEETARRYHPPEFVLAEITGNEQYTGFKLAQNLTD
jgi:CYTH domain-containing protein